MRVQSTFTGAGVIVVSRGCTPVGEDPRVRVPDGVVFAALDADHCA